jgi:hypothetical protein
MSDRTAYHATYWKNMSENKKKQRRIAARKWWRKNRAKQLEKASTPIDK